MDLSIDDLIDKLLSNKLPDSGDIAGAEFLIAASIMNATANFCENDCMQLLENVMGAIEALKATDVFADGKKNRFDIINGYFRISGR